MKKILITALVLISVQALQAQIETKIIGKWKVDSVQSNKDTRLNKDEQKQINQLRKATVEFKADGHAKFKLLLSSFNIADGYWYYNKEKDGIFITKWDDRKKDLMRLWYTELDNGQLQLYLDETPFVLYVSRVNE
jgi:hypothetical protein